VQPGGSNLSLAWPSVPDECFEVLRATSLAAPPVWQSLVSNWPASVTATTEFTHTNALLAPAGFYRIERKP
jgi:hypothetical protein